MTCPSPLPREHFNKLLSFLPIAIVGDTAKYVVAQEQGTGITLSHSRPGPNGFATLGPTHSDISLTRGDYEMAETAAYVWESSLGPRLSDPH